MTTRHGVQRSFSSYNQRVDGHDANCACGVDSKASTKNAMQRSHSGPPGVPISPSLVFQSPPRSSTVARKNMALLMSHGSNTNRRPTRGIERRRESLRKKSYAGCDTIARRSRGNECDPFDDGSVRSSSSLSRGSFADRSGLGLKDEEWIALTQLA